MVDTPLQIPEDVIIDKMVDTPPEDVIIEILSSLPVKSLLKFKCVSKSWRLLISSKHFIKTHLDKSTSNTSFAHKRIMTTVRKPSWRLQNYSLLSFLCGEQVNYALSPDFQVHNPEYLCLVGLCNGLICILIDRKYFMLWNPSTRKSKKLPDFHAGDKPTYNGYMSRYGFGFDETSLDYKVFAIFTTVQIGIGKVYSLKADSWEISWYFEHSSSTRDTARWKIQSSSSIGVRGVFASGKLHWYISSYRLINPIDYFDLKSEVWGTVDHPRKIERCSMHGMGVIDGCLCMKYYYAKNRLDVWVCNQYGVQDSWVKRFTISYHSLPLKDPVNNLLCTLPNGLVLLLKPCAFVVYNPKENRLWSPQIAGAGGFYEATLYVESLVDLPCT